MLAFLPDGKYELLEAGEILESGDWIDEILAEKSDRIQIWSSCPPSPITLDYVSTERPKDSVDLRFNEAGFLCATDILGHQIPEESDCCILTVADMLELAEDELIVFPGGMMKLGELRERHLNLRSQLCII
jgi:hypothetical protein